MKHLIALALCAIFQLPAQAQPDSSTITIRIFSTLPANTVTLTPIGNGNQMRLCPICTQEAISTPLTIKLANGKLATSSSKTSSEKITLSGAFRIHADGYSQDEVTAGQWTILGTPSTMRALITIPIERYVAAALNGESALDEPLESLKAMAIVARTYALVNRHRHAAEGFDLCDSTHCQALRFQAPRALIEQAVRETAGETLWYGAHRASIYITQHCGGIAEKATNVWPELHAPYLESHPDPYCLRRSPATWHADIDMSQAIKIFREQHWNPPSHIDSARIIKRTSTGRAALIEIAGQDKKTLISASSLRFAINRALGWNQLRSDWFDISLKNGSLHFDGKGYGHGVGLCQTGAWQMATEGHTYSEILNFYYKGTQPRITPEDSGWKTFQANGWTLLTTSSPDDLLKTGDAMWAKAQSLFPPKSVIHPTVQALPTTELFRQMTNQPGWILASTRGSNIFLQPLNILKKNGSTADTLLHEFLHALIEQEATPQTPLWLREGLVEALAENPHTQTTQPSLAAIETALAHPTNAEASQQAHTASGRIVQTLINQHGLPTVRSWLHTGIPPKQLQQLH